MKAPLTISVFVLSLAAAGCGGEDDTTAPAFTPLTFNAVLEGDAQRPVAVDVPATGTGSFSFTTGISPFFDPGAEGRKIVTYSVSVGDLSGKAVQAHIHGPADEASQGEILVPLSITSTDPTGLIINGTFTSTSNPAVSMDSLLALFNRGNAYVDIHTAAFPNGEIRGQIKSR